MRTMPAIARRVAVAATLAAAFAADASQPAFATDYCVSAPTCVGTVEPTVQAALTAAEAPGANIVTIGPGTYVGSFNTGSSSVGFQFLPAAGATVAIRGAGVVKTILAPP